MNNLDNFEVPNQVVLSGEGLEQMSKGQYDTLVKLLGRMGIHTTPFVTFNWNEAHEIQQDTNIVNFDELLVFAEDNGYTDTLVKRVWKSLQSSYVNRRDIEEKRAQSLHVSNNYMQLIREQSPIQFIEEDFYVHRGVPTPLSKLDYVKLDSVEATVAWLFEECGYNSGWYPLDRFGPRSLSFLADYVNKTANPKVPYQVKYDTKNKDEYSSEVIPPESEYSIDLDSPYLESIEIEDQTLKLVSVKGIREFCKTLGIKTNRTSHLMYLFSQVANTLTQELPDRKDKLDFDPEIISPEVVYLRTKKPSGYDLKSRRIEEWGIDPTSFVNLLRKNQEGSINIEGMTEFATFIITNYILAIQKLE